MAALLLPLFLACFLAHGVTTAQDSGNSSSCQLILNGTAVADSVTEILNDDGSKILRYNVKINNYNNSVLQTLTGEDLFRPHLWIRTVNRQGTNLLMFDDNFEVLSLQLLSIGIHDLNVQLTDIPTGCFIRNLNASQRIYQIRALLQTDFQNPSSGKEEKEQFGQICNKRVFVTNPQSSHKKAEFSYTCCTSNQKCEEIVEDKWIVVLNYILAFAIVVFMLYCPQLFSFIIDKHGDDETTEYTVKLPENCKINIENDKNQYFINNAGSKIPLDSLPNVSRALTEFTSGMAQTECNISNITVLVSGESLLAQNCHPVSIFRIFYNGIFRCNCGPNSAFKPCCWSLVWSKWCARCRCRWLSIFSILGSLLLLFTFCIPFIIEFVVYYEYIRPKFEEENNACIKLNATCAVNKNDLDLMGIRHILKQNFSIFVIVAVVSGIIAEYVLVQFLNKTAVFSNLLIKSQNEYRIFPILRILINALLSPFKDYGLFGIVMFPLYTPKLIFYVLYSFLIVLPLIKIIFGLVYFTFSSVYKQFKDKKPIWRIVVESLVCLTVYYAFLISMLVLILFVVTFYTEIFFYTLIGVIASAKKTLPFVTMLLPLGVYTRQILGKVGTVYKEFLKEINQVVLSRNEAENGELGQQNLYSHRHNAFLVQSFSKQKPKDIVQSLSIHGESDNGVYYHGNMLLVFIESDETDAEPFTESHSANTEVSRKKRLMQHMCPSKSKFDKIVSKPRYENANYYIYTSANLFYYIVDLDLPGSPGPIRSTILQAFVRLAVVIGFLGFIVIAVMGLGEAYKITLTDQLMLTVVGGVIPLIFRYGLFNYRMGSVDWGNEELTVNITKAIEQYSEEWKIVDMSFGHSMVASPDDIAINVDEPTDTDDLPPGGDNSDVKIEADGPEGAVLIPMTEMTPSVT